jgi:hypothetical protein
MRHEPLLHGSGQHRHPILLSFATPDHDLVAIEVEVLDAEPDTLLKPEARAVYSSATMSHIMPSTWVMSRPISSRLRTTGSLSGIRARGTCSIGPISGPSTWPYRNTNALNA